MATTCWSWSWLPALSSACWRSPRSRDFSRGGTLSFWRISAPSCRPPRSINRRRPDRSRLGTGTQKRRDRRRRSEEHTSELQSLMRISYAVFCLKKKKQKKSTISVQYITSEHKYYKDSDEYIEQETISHLHTETHRHEE